MKHLKLFFACMLMTVLSIGQLWATEVTVTWTASTGALGSAISSEGGTAKGTIATTSGTEISYNWSYTRTLATLKSGKSDYVSMSGSYMQLGSSNAGEDVEFRTSNIPGTIKSVTVLAGSKDSRHTGTITVGGTDYNAGSISAWASSAGDHWTGTGTSSGEIVISISCNNKKSPIYIASITIVYEEGGTPVTPTCATPTFSPSAGAVLSGTTVTLSTTTTGADIYYTKGASPADPTSASTKYTAPISITEATTIKAIAIKEGSNNSAVVSASYTVVEPLTTMDQIFSAATTAGGTATDVYITFNNWQISGVKNKNAFLTDGTKGAVIYSTSNSDFAENNVLSGTVACKVQLFKQFAEITSLTATSTGLTVSAGSTLTPAVKTIDQLSAVNTGALVKVENLTYNGTNLSDGENTIVTYTTFYSASLENGKKYDITGIFQYYDGTKQLLPRSAADIEEIIEEGAPEAPTFSPAAGTYTEVKNVTISCATDGATIHYTTDGSTPTNTSAVYSSAISVGEDMTIKAIAIKNDKESSVATAAYVINLPADPTTTYTWDLTIASYNDDADEDYVTWASTYVNMVSYKNTSSTAANNYLGGDANNRTSSRFYNGFTITFTPVSSKQITSIVITAATSGYATAFKNATWTNGTAAAGSKDTEVVVTASGAGNVVCLLAANTGATAVTVNYEPYVAPAKYAVTFATPAHGSLAIANGNTPIASGDEFVAGTELTVSTEAVSGYNLDAIKVIETGSNPENDVTSTVLSGTTLTVPAHAITVSATFVETEAPVATLTLSENGTTSSLAGEHHQGDVVTLPLTSSVDCIKDFVGWSANASCTTAPEYAPGAEYTLASTSQTLYAVYATASGTSYVKTALTNIASGSEVVVTEAKIVNEVLKIWALSYNTTSKKTIASVVAEKEIGVLSVAGLTNGFWILTKDGDNFSLTAKGTTDKLYCTSTNDGVRVGEGENNLYSINSNYMYNNGTTRYIGVQGEVDWRCYTSINSTITGQTLAFYKKTPTYSDFATTCVVALTDPVFTPEAGTYTEAKNIVITADEGTIYYTTDGTAPTSSSTEYTAPIVLDENGTTTIKAIAISATSQSAIVSATYTINMPLSTIQAVYDKAVEVGGTATAVNIKFTNWVVSGISADNKNVYVTDGEKGFVIYDSEADHGFAVNDKLNGTVATSLKLYNKYADVIGLKANAEGLTVTHDGVITPVAANIADLGAVNMGAPIILNGVLFNGSVLSDGTNTITPYTTFYADAVTSLESGKYYNITGIYVHYNTTKEIAPRSADDIAEVSLSDPEISYNPASQTITVGDAWSAPTLVNPHGLAIASYVSNNEAVATVTDGGVIALAGGTGTAVITAHTNGNATYGAGNATYTITVNPTPSGNTYRKVTATEDITDGEYLIVYETTSVAFNGALETLDAEGNSVAVVISENMIAGTTTIDAAVFTIDVTAGTLQSASGKYIGVSSNSNGLKQTEDASTYTHTFSIDEDGNAVILANFEGSTMKLRYNPSTSAGNLRFRYYKNDGQQAIQLYKKDTPAPTVYTVTFNTDGGSTIDPVEVEEGQAVAKPADPTKDGYNFVEWQLNGVAYDFTASVTASITLDAVWEDATPVEPELDWTEARTDLTEGYYYTMCLDKAVTHIDGASIWRVLSKTQEGSGIILEEVTSTLDAGRPYFFYATASVLKVVYTGGAVGAPLTEGNNGLVGSFEQKTIAQSENNFILYNNMLYFVNSTAYVGANRAYLNMEAVPDYNESTPAPGRRRVTMQTNGEQVATGMDEVNVNSEVAVKTLIDGQLFILRGQKMYDTTGRLVK